MVTSIANPKVRSTMRREAPRRTGLVQQAPSEASPLTAEVGGWPELLGGVRLMAMSAVVTVNDLLDGHVQLDIKCLDRIYLNGYVPNLQVAGQVVIFMTQHLGLPIPSPAIMEKIGTQFRRSVRSFADMNEIPMVRFNKGDRKIEVMRPLPRCAGQDRSVRSCRDRGRAGVPERVRLHRTLRAATACPGSVSPRPTVESRVSTFTCGMWTSGPGSSRSAPTSLIRSRCGSTGTNGPNAKPATPGSGSPSCPTGSPPAQTQRACRRSVTVWDRGPSKTSSTAG